jgi:hypothetical protein
MNRRDFLHWTGLVAVAGVIEVKAIKAEPAPTIVLDGNFSEEIQRCLNPDTLWQDWPKASGKIVKFGRWPLKGGKT